MADEGNEVRELRAKIAVATVTALWRAGEDLLGRAANLAPLEEGTLRGSGALAMIVNGTRFDGAGAFAAARARAVSLAYAGKDWSAEAEVSFNTVYAAAQHEGIDFEHPLGGQAKYLEQPFAEQVGRYRSIIAKAAASATSGSM